MSGYQDYESANPGVCKAGNLQEWKITGSKGYNGGAEAEGCRVTGM